MQALLGFTSEARWLRHARAHPGHLFRHLPRQPGYNKRLRNAAGLLKAVIRLLPVDTTLWTDDVWVVDSTPVECGRSRETAHRSELAGWAQYGYCASHSRPRTRASSGGLRLHLVCTLGGLPVAFALTGAKADERTTLLDILDTDWPTPGSNCCARPQRRVPAARRTAVQTPAPDHRVHQLDLQGPTRPRTPRRTHPTGVIARVLQRVLALTAAIWHNDHTDQPIKRSLTAYDH